MYSAVFGVGTAMFSPQGFPNGQIVYNLTTTHDRDHEYLEPFEPHRRTFLVRHLVNLLLRDAFTHMNNRS